MGSFWIKLAGAGIGILMLVAACIYLYQQGKNAGIGIANTHIAEYQKKIQDLNTQLARKEILVRERVITEYHTKEIVRTQIEYKNRDIIKTVVPKQYYLSQGWVYAHDQSVLGLEIDPALASNPNPSTVSDQAALNVVSDNYNISNKNTNQLEALQQYIREVGIKVTNDQKTTNSTK